MIKIALGIVLLITLTACHKCDDMTLEMEIYTHVFDNILGNSNKPLRALIRVPESFRDQFEVGNPVFISFNYIDSKLILDTITTEDNFISDSNIFWLEGSFIGTDEITNEALIGFKFHFTNTRNTPPHNNGNTTSIIVASFAHEKNKLIFKNINSIKTIDKKPIMFK